MRKKQWNMLAVGILVVLTMGGFAAAPGLVNSHAIRAMSGLTAGLGTSPPSATHSGPTSSAIPSAAPSFSGLAAKSLIGPFKTVAGPFVPSQSHQLSNLGTHAFPSFNPKVAAAIKTVQSERSSGPSISTIPTISCDPLGAGCDAISASSGGATGVKGINAVDSSGLYGITIEPADQGVCAGNGFVMETNNIGEMMVFGTGLHLKSSDIALDSVFGLTTIPASLGGPWSSGGDISCLYDYDHGGHWIITEFVSASSWAVGGPFGGCFAGVANTCYEGIAVSVDQNPLGAYNVYFLNPNGNPAMPGAPYILNDFTKIATTRDAFLVFYDAFAQLGGGISPGGGFDGAQEWAINKKALELGYPVITPAGGPNPYFTAVTVNMGFIGTPDGFCATVGACWYQVIPAQSPDPSQFDNSFGGSGFMLAPLDFFGAGDNRIAVLDWTGLSNLNSYNCATCGSIGFGGVVWSGVASYYNLGFTVPQRTGPIPLGDECGFYGLSPLPSCPEGGLASNGDGFTAASLAGGNVWGGISTVVFQTFATGKGCPCTEAHMGVAYYVFGTSSFDAGGVVSVTDDAYVSAAHEELTFPAVAAEGSLAQDGGNLGAIMTFTLSGNGGPHHADSGGYFPSTAYGRLTSSSHGLVGSTINIADKGKAPQDGFTEYQGYPGPTGPRWGDYSAAIFLPHSGGKVYFSTQYIQYPNCNDATFAIDPSCGGTRDPNANWGTSVNYAVP